MNYIFSLVKKELFHFERLGKNAQRLIFSYFLYGIGIPLLNTFINAFIWKSSHEFLPVSLYNIGNWVALPITFFVNGILLRFIPTTLLYSLGLILTAVAPFIVIIFNINGLLTLFMVGLLFGIGWGLFWSNRTFYTLRLTDDSNRNYFFSLTFTIDTITAIIVPFVIGWIIVFGGDLSYRILAFLLFALYLAAGAIILPLSMHSSEHSHGIVTIIKGKWNIMRLACFLFGFQSGINFIFPSILVLLLLGNEGILGSVNSLGALLSALVIYQIGKRSLAHHRIYVFAFGILILILAAFLFTLYPFSFGVVIYVVAITITVNFTWSSYSPMLMDLIDRYTPTKKQNRFKYIVDHEIFLNLGRMMGISILFLSMYVTSQSLALRFTPIVIASFQIIVIYLLMKIVKK